MYDRILKQIQEKVRTRQYVMTLHAEEEMDDDGLTKLSPTDKLVIITVYQP